ncbi:MAG: Pr6Pr family membrane protein [Saprospiraceae bacterium]
MKIKLSLLFAILGWFAIITQFVLMMNQRVTSVAETSIRFFSFFTILTNCIVALYFTYVSLKERPGFFRWFDKPGTLTAITVYITIVGLVYQVVLRKIWEPTGMQMIVDELLHTVIPVLVILFWYIYENKSDIKWTQLPGWLLYPFLYLIFVLFRGQLSGFYPYFFIDLNELGWSKVLINAIMLILVFLLVSSVFIYLGKVIGRFSNSNDVKSND